MSVAPPPAPYAEGYPPVTQLRPPPLTPPVTTPILPWPPTTTLRTSLGMTVIMPRIIPPKPPNCVKTGLVPSVAVAPQAPYKVTSTDVTHEGTVKFVEPTVVSLTEYWLLGCALGWLLGWLVG